MENKILYGFINEMIKEADAAEMGKKSSVKKILGINKRLRKELEK